MKSDLVKIRLDQYYFWLVRRIRWVYWTREGKFFWSIAEYTEQLFTKEELKKLTLIYSKDKDEVDFKEQIMARFKLRYQRPIDLFVINDQITEFVDNSKEIFNLNITPEELRDYFLKEITKLSTISYRQYLFYKYSKSKFIFKSKNNKALEITELFRTKINAIYPKVFLKEFNGQELDFAEQLLNRYAKYLNKASENDYEKLIDNLLDKYSHIFKQAYLYPEKADTFLDEILREIETWWTVKEYNRLFIYAVSDWTESYWSYYSRRSGGFRTRYKSIEKFKKVPDVELDLLDGFDGIF